MLNFKVRLLVYILCLLIIGIKGSQKTHHPNTIPGVQFKSSESPTEIPNSDSSKVIPIVSIIPRRLKIDLFAINSVLDKIGDRPFAVYSINGPSRTGKSYLLSRFVNYLQRDEGAEMSDGFEWRGETDRCTRGINIWSDPLEVQLENGSRVPVLLVDTQGCFDEKSPLELDAKLFAIATLLSSVQVFNTIRTIDEATLQFLEAFTGVASMCNTFATPREDPSANIPDFQKLIVLIRDFQFRDYKLGYYDNTHKPPQETKNFKLDKLNPHDGQPEGHQRVRQNIIQTFQETAAYLMPHPGKELSMYDNPNKLDEDFKDAQDELIALLFNPKNLVLKTLNQKLVTGTEFKEHVGKWTEVLEKIEDLKLPKTSEGASEIQYLTGIETARNEYSRVLDGFMKGQKFRISELSLRSTHESIISTLCKHFEDKLYFRNHNKNSIRFKKELEEWGRHAYEEYQRINLNNYEVWTYYAITAWTFIYPYLLYIILSLALWKIIRWLTGF